MAEMFDLVDAKRTPLGRTVERGASLPSGEYHVVVMGLLVGPDERILITRRSSYKTEPGSWECTTGSVLAGETSRNAIAREIKEEIGIDVRVLADAPVHTFVEEDSLFDLWEIPIETEIQDLVLQAEEVCEARYATREQIRSLISTGQAVRRLAQVESVLRERMSLNGVHGLR